MKLRGATRQHGIAEVEIDRSMNVFASQKAIADAVSSAHRPSQCQAPSRSAILGAEERRVARGALFSKPASTELTRMRSTGKLDRHNLSGPAVDLGVENVHVVVDILDATVGPFSQRERLRVGMNQDAAHILAPYQQVAMQLKDDPAVAHIVTAVQYVAEDSQSQQFIVLESSSGMDKTQMAFNLMVRDDMEVYYVVCEAVAGKDLHQGMYTTFDARSATFLKCFEADARHVAEIASSQMQRSGTSLHTFEFIRALLNGEDTMQSPVSSYEQVKEVIKAHRSKQRVGFLDDFPLQDEQERNFVKLRFMRNVFRTLKLPVILSSTHDTARNAMTKANNAIHSRRELDVRWCVMVPELPRFHHSTLPSMVVREDTQPPTVRPVRTRVHARQRASRVHRRRTDHQIYGRAHASAGQSVP